MSSSTKTLYDIEIQQEILNAGCHRSVIKALILKK